MSNQSFRDVNTVVAHGLTLVGVTRVGLSDEGAEINYNADANAYRQDVGLTKQVAGVDVERMSSSKMRDVVSAVFTAGATGSATLGRVQRVQASQRSSVLRDSGDADAWIRYVGVSDINGDAEVSFRDLAQIESGALQKGRKGTLTIKVPVARTGFGLPSSTATETHVIRCMVKSISKDAKHGDIGEAKIAFAMYGATNPWSSSGATGGASLAPIALGAKGQISWNAPAADAAASEATTVTGCVCIEREMTLEHGGYARASMKFEAGASDGLTPPIS